MAEEQDPRTPNVRWLGRPELRRPVLITAFEGWTDAGSAASAAVQFLSESWGAEAFCEIDPEEFFDFSATRPLVHRDPDGTRRIEWPSTELRWARVGDGLDVVLLVGHEPQLRWKTFCREVTAVADVLGVDLVVTLGALLADVPHTRPVSVYGAAYEEAVAEELALTPSRYEGPTGIVGVLHDRFLSEDVRSAALWAAVPSYVPGAPSPKAALALVARVTHLLGVTVDADELSEAAADYEAQIDEALADDEESAEYVAELERTWDESAIEDAGADSLVTEIEAFLRRNG